MTATSRTRRRAGLRLVGTIAVAAQQSQGKLAGMMAASANRLVSALGAAEYRRTLNRGLKSE